MVNSAGAASVQERPLAGNQGAELPEFEDIEYLRVRQAEGAALPERVAQREDGAGEAAVGDQLERRGGSGITDEPHLAQRVQERADAGERPLVRAGEDLQGTIGDGWQGAEQGHVDV